MKTKIFNRPFKVTSRYHPAFGGPEIVSGYFTDKENTTGNPEAFVSCSYPASLLKETEEEPELSEVLEETSWISILGPLFLAIFVVIIILVAVFKND